MASSSSCVHNNSYQYDVFLSFSGEDTRKTFIDHLYVALDQRGICTFKDDERLEKGKEIKDELLQSIEDSRLYIIVFSKRYASSSWCLNELLKIMECHKNGQTAFPVFYDVDPSEVRKQSGLVEEAIATFKDKSESEIGKWREALTEAANLSGWDVRKTTDGHEAKVIKLIVQRVSYELDSINTDINENLVGMEQRMKDLDSCLEVGLDDVRVIGIKGMGGAGKTTLARAIFDKISINFEGKIFVENVRERASQSGLMKLQEQVLREVLKDKNINVSGSYEGKKLMGKKLRGKKLLLVLDDVDHAEQLEELAGDPNWFKPGSRIIITTRDEHVLNAYTEKRIIDVSLLSDDEAILLFSRHAFKRNTPTQEYERQTHEIVRYAAGLPLTIKVLGSFLRGKNKHEWRDALERLKTIPLNETLKKLELSFENLENDHKEIFLTVACFLNGWEKDDAIRLLESCDFFAEIGLRVLEQKSLITLKNTYGIYIQMHDHLVEMGMNIVRREHVDEPSKHSRLWVYEEIKRVLATDLVNEATRYITLEFTPDIVLERLRNMRKLRCLIMKYWDDNSRVKIHKDHQYFPNSLQYLSWPKYLHWCLPKTFEADNLVALEMPSSNIKQLWEEGKVMKKLKFLNLSFSKLRNLDLGLTPNLQRLDLKYCTHLVNLYVYGGCLQSLVYLNLYGCTRLKSYVFIEQLKSLEVLHIDELSLREFSDYIITGHSNNSLLELHLSHSPIEEVPSSIENLHKLVSLFLGGFYNLKSLPGSVCSLQHLRTLNLQFSAIEELPEDLGQLESLEELNLSRTLVKHLPRSICMLKRLNTLILEGCKLIEKLPEDIGQLESLEKLDLEDCSNLRDLPNSICKLKRLKELKLKRCKSLVKLPDDLGELECLQLLCIWDTGITHLPESISLLKGLKIPEDDFIFTSYYYSSDDDFISPSHYYSSDDDFISPSHYYSSDDDFKNSQILGFQHLSNTVASPSNRKVSVITYASVSCLFFGAIVSWLLARDS